MFITEFSADSKSIDDLGIPDLDGSLMDSEEFRNLVPDELLKLANSQEIALYDYDNVESQPNAGLENVMEFQNAAMQNGMSMNVNMDNPEEVIHAPEADAHLNNLPTLEPIDLGHHFVITLKGGSKDWFYDRVLEKIYIRMDSAMTINVSYPLVPEKLFLRAMILFDKPSDIHELVKPCPNHKDAAEKKAGTSNAPPYHILKCHHPRAMYLGDENGAEFKNRLAVRIALENGTRDDDGNYWLDINYEFACQNSCGMNRKSTSIVFTLENSKQQLLGKKVVQFKVCSSPRRDANTDLQQNINKRKAGSEPFSKGKRPKFAPKNETTPEVKTESDDSEGWVRENINMPDKGDMLHVLNCVYDRIAGKMHREGICSTKYDEELRAIEQKISRLENES